MPEFILHALRADPEIGVFLAIALGVFVGRIHIGSFHLATGFSLGLGFVGTYAHWRSPILASRLDSQSPTRASRPTQGQERSR
ncbi:YidE/YbjL duplication [Pseudomonas fluorescens]|uniref:YidE/YbjL duplication n=1 Tax=Pseudomonas fluorescens TaxID=294 RepID=A0A3S4P8A6_PSEFL|nr:hypothetical protein [Pseudomonas fluorescens]VEF11189.1 YidE/YbjL duplication [Pseudomonas fluorescens]